MARHQAFLKGIFCNRTLNLHRIRAIGYDMDYTLIHYHVDQWEKRAYAYLKERLAARGLPVSDLVFDADLVIRGLAVDTRYGNVVKADRFGYIKRAFHGTRTLPYDTLRRVYADELVNLSDSRWHFLNTLFSLSEACMYMQLVDQLDAGEVLPSTGYGTLHRMVREALDEAHLEGQLKAEIIGTPDVFVDADPDIPRTLLDQKASGKKVLLITNSEWSYAVPMLSYTMDPFLPGGQTWRDLFDLVIVNARKPHFFSQRSPLYQVVTDDGLLREHRGVLEKGRVYVGGSAFLVEQSLGLSGEEILYVGDHIFVDVNVSKNLLRWRTALIVRELEDELRAIRSFADDQNKLNELMLEKVRLEADLAASRLADQRGESPESVDRPPGHATATIREMLAQLDRIIEPLVIKATHLSNHHWGLLMRAGNGKSHLARQIERYADVYTGRVSNFLEYTPYAYLRAYRGTLPHETGTDQKESGPPEYP